MIGGKVIEIYRQVGRPASRVWCMDPKTGDELAVYVMIPPEVHAQVGDDLWWQGMKAFWTPADRRSPDWVLTRVGNSFDPRPPALKGMVFKGVKKE